MLLTACALLTTCILLVAYTLWTACALYGSSPSNNGGSSDCSSSSSYGCSLRSRILSLSLLSTRVFLLLSISALLLLGISALLLLGISAFVLLASCILSLLAGRSLLFLCRLRNTCFHEHPEDLIVLFFQIIIEEVIEVEVHQVVLVGYLMIFQESLYIVVRNAYNFSFFLLLILLLLGISLSGLRGLLILLVLLFPLLSLLRNTGFHQHPEDLLVLICHVIIKKMIQIEVRQIILIGYLVIFQERLYVIVAEVCHGLRLLVFLLLDFLTSSPLRLLGDNAPKRVFMRHPPSDE